MFKKGTDIFSPARIFMIVWTLAIGLAELKLSGHQIVWNLYSWFVLLLSLLSVLLGMFIIYVINLYKTVNTTFSIRSAIILNKIDSEILFKLILLIFFGYIVSYLIIFAIVGFIPLFTPQPNLTRTKWSVFGFGLIIHLAPTVIYFVILYYLTVQKMFGKKIIVGVILIITLFTFFLLVQRFSLVISIVLTMIFLYYGTYKFRPRNVMIILLFLIVFMYGISTIRVSTLFIEYLYYSARMKFGPQYAFLTEPYMYIVMNLENFANSVYHLNDFTYGYFTFDFVLALSGLKHWIAEYTYIEQFPFVINADYNTYSMFFTYYRDFGLLGIFFIPFFLGVVVSILYYKMRQKPDINSISFYGMFLFVLIFSFFIPMLSWLNFILNLTIIYFCTKFVIKNQTSSNVLISMNSDSEDEDRS
jgi:oligosaccharide repeat unit polymerase